MNDKECYDKLIIDNPELVSHMLALAPKVFGAWFLASKVLKKYDSIDLMELVNGTARHIKMIEGGGEL